MGIPFPIIQENKMKLEMRYGDLDIRFEIEDQDNYNALEVIQHLKDLLSELTSYDSVLLSVVSIPEVESEDNDSDEDSDDEDGEAVI